MDEQRPDRRRGLRLPVGADARRAGRRGRRRLPADHGRPLPRRGQGRRRRVRPALPRLEDAVLRPAPRAPAQGRPRFVDRCAGQRRPRVRRSLPGRLRRPRPRRGRAHAQRPVLGHPGGARPARAAPPGRYGARRRPRGRRRRHRAAHAGRQRPDRLGGPATSAADPDRARAGRHRARAAHGRRSARRHPRPAGPQGPRRPRRRAHRGGPGRPGGRLVRDRPLAARVREHRARRTARTRPRCSPRPDGPATTRAAGGTGASRSS